MKRIDYISGDDGDVIFGLCLHGGVLIPCEGDLASAKLVLNDPFFIPASDAGGMKRIRGVDDPEAFLEWAPSRYTGQDTFAEPYDDDDSLYDLKTGMFTGDDENPPLPGSGLESQS